METLAMMLKYRDFKGPAVKLEDIDLPRIGHEIGVGEDEIHMMIDVETAGSSFDSQGRPKMLFEPHIFYRELGAGPKRDQAVRAGLAYAKWGTKKYPSDSYPRLAQAMAIDEAAALRSASWGGSQILGDNYKMIGYASVQDMVNAFCEDEDNHIEGMVEFIKSAGIDDDLRKLTTLKRATTAADCAPIARVYNGPGYAQNAYDKKMATAHNKWRGIGDTAWTPDSLTGPIIVPDAQMLTKEEIAAGQQLLKDKGYIEVGKIDGIMGKDTAAAVAAFQIVEGMPVDGKMTEDLIEILKTAKMRPVSESRANASTAEVVANAAPPVAETVQQQSLLKNVMIGVGTVSGLGTLADGGVPDLDQLSNSINKTQMILGMLGDKLPWIIALGAAGVAIYVASGALKKLKDGFKQGTVR